MARQLDLLVVLATAVRDGYFAEVLYGTGFLPPQSPSAERAVVCKFQQTRPRPRLVEG